MNQKPEEWDQDYAMWNEGGSSLSPFQEMVFESFLLVYKSDLEGMNKLSGKQVKELFEGKFPRNMSIDRFLVREDDEQIVK